MRLAFITTQSSTGSTNIGRIFPLAEQISRLHEVHILVHRGPVTTTPQNCKIHITGRDPFTRSITGKSRLSGLRLVARMKLNAFRAVLALLKIKPDTVIISKALPESVFAGRFFSLLKPQTKVILDVDDYELSANHLASLSQRAAVHWAERTGAKLAFVIVAATPFLSDHFEQLTRGKKKIVLIATGISKPPVEIRRRLRQNLLYLGSVSVSSGHRVDLLPEIMQHVRQQFPAVMLTIAGDGDDIKKLKDNFKQRGLESAVTWIGRFDLAAAGHLVNQAAVVIDPIDDSITNRAKSSSRTLIAAASGKAIVTSNIGVRPHFLPDRLHDRLFAAPGQAPDYAQKISDVLHNPLSISEQTALIQRAANYTWEKLANNYSKILA